jgi:predicted RND superfamily exporter protein
LGAMTEYFVIFFILPGIFPKFLDVRLKPLKFKFIRVNIFPNKKIIYALVLPIFIAPFLSSSLSFFGSPFGLFHHDHPVSKIKNEIKATRGWEHFVEVYFYKDNPTNDTNEKILEIKKLPNIAWIESPRLFLDHQKNLPADMTSLSLDTIFNSKVGEKYYFEKSERALAFVRESDTESIEKLKLKINAICKNSCRATGELVAFGEYSKLIVETLSESLALSLILVLIVIALLIFYHDIKNGWIICLSVLWGPLIVYLLFVFFKIHITLVNCMLLSTVSGISGDNVIQFIFNQKNKTLADSVEQLGPGAFILTLLLIFLCTPFYFSSFRNVQNSGILLMFSLVLICFGDVYVLRGLLETRRKAE